MPKAEKKRSGQRSRQSGTARQESLLSQLEESKDSGYLSTKSLSKTNASQARHRQRSSHGKADEDEMAVERTADFDDVSDDEAGESGHAGESRLSSAESARILRAATLQQTEVDEEDNSTHSRGHSKSKAAAAIRSLGGASSSSARGASGASAKAAAGAVDSDEETENTHDELMAHAAESAAFTDDAITSDLALSESERASLAAFAPTTAIARQSLNEIIMEKIAQHEQQLAARGGVSTAGRNVDEILSDRIDSKVISVYKAVGRFLSHYTSGKVPKPLKIIPTLRNWEEILYLTTPESWTAQAVYVATKLFVSNLTSKLSTKFLLLVLLPRLERDIESNKRLNYHLYQAALKAAYKPAAFFKGLVFPIAEQGCTVRQAVIVASLLSKASIPPLHAGAALMKLSQLAFSGPCELFIRTILNKKYSLPLRALHCLVERYCAQRFLASQERLPVIWHSTLLCFVQRYKGDLNAQQRAALRELCKLQAHPAITPEIVRELAAARAAEQAANAANAMQIAASASQAAEHEGAAMQAVGTGVFVYGTAQGHSAASQNRRNGNRMDTYI